MSAVQKWRFMSIVFITAGFIVWAGGGLKAHSSVEAYELFLAAAVCSICAMWLEGKRERKANEVERSLFVAEGTSSFFARADHQHLPHTSFKSNLLWYQRLWRLVVNPFSYLVRGEMRW